VTDIVHDKRNALSGIGGGGKWRVLRPCQGEEYMSGKTNILKEIFNFMRSTDFKFLISGFSHEITIRRCVKPQKNSDAKF